MTENQKAYLRLLNVFEDEYASDFLKSLKEGTDLPLPKGAEQELLASLSASISQVLKPTEPVFEFYVGQLGSNPHAVHILYNFPVFELTIEQQTRF